jgi:lipopolysaccharide transport system ATP-binding protein
MSEIAIRAENLGKLYRIGEREQYLALRDVLARTFSAPARLFGRKTASSNTDSSHLWAVKDISFEIRQGDVVGIIGRNGAGKSTLLKILARVTKPTKGLAHIHGRMGTLLEVGTGFHPELTGRENVFLSGAILGMKKTEIQRNFDEIVAFAEVERFIDTPVKHYSSGMYMRLAFAVAAHLEPEVLVVDEVLAVGDAAFQKKCLGKMGDVASGGRTVLFVSHNMNAVQRLCNRAILMDSGKVAQQGSVRDCVKTYSSSAHLGAGGRTDLSRASGVKRRGNGVAQFEAAELMNLDGDLISTVHFGEPVRLRLTIRSERRLRHVMLGFSFVAVDGTEIQGTAMHDGGIANDLRIGSQVLECRVDPMLLTPGRYFLRAAIFAGTEFYEHIDEFLHFEVAPFGDVHEGRIPSSHYVGYVYQPYQWSIVSGGLEEKAVHALLDQTSPRIESIL